ncbi:MAG: hypothetical protein AB8H12_14575 [Lewinella sp.]
MFKNSQIPLWINILLILLVLIMAMQVYWFYFDHQSLIDAGITTEGIPNLNIIYTTAGRLVAMIAISIFVLVSQNANQYLIVLLMSIFREGQESFIDPLFPYVNAGPVAVDIGMHAVIVALEIWAFITVYRIAKKENKAVTVS